MSHECTHLLPSGQKCKAPAVSGTSLCRHHGPRRRIEQHKPFVLPQLNDQRSLLNAVSEVLQALHTDRVKRSEAATLLFGIHLASRLIEKTGPIAPDTLAPSRLQVPPSLRNDARNSSPDETNDQARQSLSEVKHLAPTSQPHPKPQHAVPPRF